MFSGLIREIASVRGFSNNILRLACGYRAGMGDSIAVNGACLSVVALHSDGFSLELSKHTQESIAMENYQKRVHIEPALAVDSRLEGHIVQGHIDAIGVISRIERAENQVMFKISLPSKKLCLAIPQGSIAIDGISLTIGEVCDDGFWVVIIPQTFSNTLFSSYGVGRRVNIETDIIARSIAHILGKMSGGRFGILGELDSSKLDSGELDSAGLDSTKSGKHKQKDIRLWSELDSILMRY